MDKPVLRDYQTAAIHAIYNTIKSGRTRVACSMPTGSGKSLILAKIASDAAGRNRKALILVHRKALVGQLEAAIIAMSSIQPRIIAAGFKVGSKDSLITIAMVQTLERRELPEGIGLIILDEAHITAYFECFEKCLNKYLGSIWALSKVPVIGFSASFWRTNKKEGYCRWFNAKVQGISPRGLINRGFLTKPRVYTYDNMFDAGKLETDNSGDFTLASIRSACNELYLQDVVDKWHANYGNLKSIFFVSCIEHAVTLTSFLSDKGIKAELVKGNTPKAQRDKTFSGFKSGSVQALINVGVCTEGYNEPSIECVVLARPSTSQALIVQMIGRGLRLYDGKKEAITLDFGECIQSLLKNPRVTDESLEDDIFEYNDFTLCSQFKPKEAKPMVKLCVHCEHEMSVFLKVCPNCLGEQPKTTDKVIPDTVSFPELVEYLSLKELKAMKFFRQELRKCFDDDLPLNIATAKCIEKFDAMPSLEWGRGAIFQERYSELNYSFYRWLMGHQGFDSELIDYSLAIEFGDYSNNELFNHLTVFGSDIHEGYRSRTENASPGELLMINKVYEVVK